MSKRPVTLTAGTGAAEANPAPPADEEFAAALDNLAYESARALTIWIPAIWLLTIPIPLLRFPGSAGVSIVILQLVDLSILIGFHLALRRDRIPRRWAHAVLAIILAAPIWDLAIRGCVAYGPDRLIILELCAIGFGLVCLSGRWLVLLLLLAAATGGFVIGLAPAGHLGPTEGAVTLGTAMFIAVLARATRLNAVRHIEQLRRQDTEHLREAQENAAKFRGILNRIHDVFFRTKPDGTIQMVSPSVERFGYRPEDLEGRIALAFYTDTTQRDQFTSLLLEKGYVTDYEINFQRKDGSTVTAAASANVLLDAQGQIIGFEGLLHDISERKRQEALRREEAHLAESLAKVGRELISSLSEPALLNRLCRLTTEVLACDFSHTYLWRPKDNAFAPVFSYGHTPEAWEAVRVVKLAPDIIAPFLEQLRNEEVVETNIAAVIGNPLARRGEQLGITRLLHVGLRRGDELIGFHAAGYRGRDEKFTAAQLKIAQGIAQLASFALENSRLVNELEQAGRVKSEFVATMSHELRTPLNVIMGYNSLLHDGAFGDVTVEQADTLQRMERSTGELLDLINTTLNLSRLEGGKIPLELSEVRLHDLLAEIDAETGDHWGKTGVAFRWNVPEVLPGVRTDRVKLKVVLKNLIGNAFKFTAEGSVSVDARNRDGGIEITVADTGIGIAPEVLPTIFEPFRQGDSSMTRAYGGVGLGLYIVHRLIDRLGGTVDVVSKPVRGSTFRLWIPSDASGGRA